ncbi:MAG: 30S ribosomal protein S4 [Candidatus Zambryskibacteria bacterium CG10_big_fil_rev_8_21_14_0_10_34_34]|uniref:Small ribosomal subunit protein uS4 n=1 Tax=Candidatus Zambryskibacteria bacterium CG10_big_fil_rev_8_21_14_0_10_34_34 TaxID=1975114 RepID=A0A2H0R1B6_9BACT|nr:MAG: 30S ribosomal protein S4 [Candidatus Zambryskibacteria bacterium CG10_big_fil_rev_8_21_14_0_10_34_34]
MIIGPKYKIARRLQAPIFEKTQTQKFSLREERKNKKRSFRKQKTDYGIQLNEKQKARMFYCVTEKQFAKYVKQALEKKVSSPTVTLLKSLEHRLDNVVWRAGILPTHLSARQAVAHGHFLVNGKRVYVPSYSVSLKDKITIRERSKGSKLFNELEEKMKETQSPDWMSWDNIKKEISIKEGTIAEKADLLFDLGQVIEYYQR